MIYRIPPIYWAITAFAILVRIFFYFYTPLIDNDSIVIFMAARELVAQGVVSKVNTLPVLITGLLYQVFGEHILWARLPQLLGGIGTTVLLIIAGRKYGAVAGITAAIIYAFLPIAILYGSIAKSYSLLVFLILAGAMLFDHAVDKQCSTCSALSALMFIAAFGCYTFAAISIFPISVLFLISLFRKKARPYLKPSLITGAVFSILLGGVVAWRWKEFGWSVLNDYVTDWRFDLATRIWEARWVGLTDIWGVGIAFLIPGIILIAFKAKILRKQGALVIYSLIFIPVVLLLWLLNPVNHFPRVLLPSLPFLSFLLGMTLQRMSEEKTHWGNVLAWVGTTISALALLYPRFNAGDMPLWFFTPDTGSGISLTILTVALFFLFFLTILRPIRKVRIQWQPLIPVMVIVLAGATGPVLALQSVDAQARVFQSRAQLVDDAGVTGIMGGGDYQNLAHTGKESVAWMLDLTPQELDQVLSGNILEVCKERGISHVIVARNDPDGILDMLKVMATQNGMKVDRIERVFTPLFDMSRATRLIDNDFGSLYAIDGITKNLRTKEQGDRLMAYHSPYEYFPSLSTLAFGKEAGKILYKSGKDDPSIKLQASITQSESMKKLYEKPIEGSRMEMSLENLGDYSGENLIIHALDSNGDPFREIGTRIQAKYLNAAPEDAP